MMESRIMNVSNNFYQRNEKWIILLLILLSYPLFFHKLGDRDLWSPDEDEYVQVNREMVLEGHWIYPTANGQPYNIKPPLFNWLGSSFAKLNGEVTEYTSRLPSALAASAGLLVLYFLGRRLFGHRAGFLSALIIGTSPIYIEFGRWIQINMISTVLLMATLGLFYWGYSDERKRAAAYLLMYVPMGLGTLNMGPVNVVMPMIVIGLYLIAMKDVKHVIRLKIGWGILIYLAIVAPWYVAVSLKGGYAHNLIILTNITRYFKEFAHVRPFYYYLTTTPPYFLPWFIFLPGAFYLCFSQQTKMERKQLLFPFLWVVGLFVFFSISKTKRSEYLLPIFPAMALLVGYVIDRSLRCWDDSLFWRRMISWPVLTVTGLLVTAGIGIAIYGATLSMDWLFVILPISILLTFGALLVYYLFDRGRRMMSIVTIVLILLVSLAYGVGPVVSKKNEIKSAKPFCLKVRRYLPPGEKLKMYDFGKPIYGVYTERYMDVAWSTNKLTEWFNSKKAVYVVTNEEAYLEIKDNFPLPIYIVLREWIDHRYVLLLSNRPAPADPPGSG
jgi:4-amino-4-deoxy-L-arabinose transferase-like glycosyltransferase